MRKWWAGTTLTCGCAVLAGAISLSQAKSAVRPFLPDQLAGASVDAAGAPGDAVEVPFELVDGQVIVRVRLPNGSEVPMNLDSGVFPSVLDRTVADALGIPTEPSSGSVAGMGSRSLSYEQAHLARAQLGAFAFADLPIIVTETRHFRVGGEVLLGTLGESFFRRARVEIDYPARTLRLWPRGEEFNVHPPVLTTETSGVTPRVQLTVLGQPLDGWLDTGSSAGLVLSEAKARALGLGAALADAQTVEGIGTRGPFQAKLIRVDSVRVAGHLIQDLHAVIADAPTWIGNELWRHFRLTFDYERGYVGLVRPK